ncbi:esterase/lipase family protein [Janthinobacterium fluminis]|uniref:Alpha/beta fold hydrolase n=1 Tax=Janthinobacterium fluminis TaxID=2987524 RepID=A0ABT5K6S1_9BURK|nr:alpha/beta fold hydrolase [Janthinobacterium fluminis]MDC8760108.1 alpha/beta fold hydrolase [Janthinobacterium fluminis]
MIARILKLLLALQLLLLAGLWLALLKVWPALPAGAGLALAVAALLALRLLITANNFLLSWRCRSVTPAPYRPSPAARLRLFAGEFVATLLSSSWSMAWPRLDTFAGRGGAGLPVLLVHGYVCNRGYWAPLSRRLRRAGISHAAVDLEPLGAGIDDYAPLLRRAIAALCAASGSAQVILVCHSMGGLVARAYLRSDGEARVARVITLGTPHNGTALAHFGAGLNARQMRRGSDWLGALDAGEDMARRALFTSIFSHHDNIVAPQTSACLAGANNRPFGAIGHVALGRHPAILACVLEEIAQASAAPDAAAAPRAHGLN